jgi:ABC-2 type transport system permease protein
MSRSDLNTSSPTHLLNVMVPMIIHTFRRTIMSKRTIAMVLFLLVPFVIAIVYYFKAPADTPLTDFTQLVFDVLYLQLLIPLVTLIMAIDLFHTDFKNKTISYVLIRPVPRSVIFISRLIGLILAELVIITIPVLMTFFLMMAKGTSASYWDDLGAFLLIIAVAVALYSAFFTFLGILLKHPLLPGLAVAFFWEVTVSKFGKTIPRFTVMYYLRSIGYHLVDVKPYTGITNHVSGSTIGITLALIFLACCGVGIWSLYRKQLY